MITLWIAQASAAARAAAVCRKIFPSVSVGFLVPGLMLAADYPRSTVMPLEFQQIDAFSDRPFAGNPAMVYRLEAWLDEALMQRIAATK